MSCDALLRVVSGVFCGRGASGREQYESEAAQGDHMDVAIDGGDSEPELLQGLCADALFGLAHCLSEHCLSGQPEMKRRYGRRQIALRHLPIGSVCTAPSRDNASQQTCLLPGTFVLQIVTV